MTKTQLIDNGLIAELAGVLPAHELAETMTRFAHELLAKHRRLEQALSEHDCNAICDVAHAMTGTCGTFGAMRLSEQCRELLEICETHKRNGTADASCCADMEARVSDINHSIDATLEALEKALLAQGF